MCKVNELRLLEGLTGKGITLNTRSLAKYTADNGVLANVRCTRRRGNITLPPKALGLHPDKWKDSSQEFFAEHVNLGRLTLIPKEKEAKLSQLEGQARSLVEKATVNGNYVPLCALSELREDFKEIRQQYLDAVEDVAQNWESITEDFKTGVQKMVAARCKGKVLKRDRERVIKEIFSRIPSMADYRSYATMELELRAFPTTGVTTEGLLPDLEDALNATWKDDVVANAIKGIEAGIGEIFSQCCRIIDTYTRVGKIHGRSTNAPNRIAARSKKLNVFANPMLESLASRLECIGDLNDDDIAERVEDCLLDAIQYARSTGINLDMSECPYTEEQIRDMLEVKVKFEKKGA